MRSAEREKVFGLVKPSELALLSAGYLADAALAAGLTPGVFNVVTGQAEASEALVRYSDVDKIAFTGSTATGRKIAEAAAPTLKHVSASSPYSCTKRGSRHLADDARAVDGVARVLDAEDDRDPHELLKRLKWVSAPVRRDTS